MLPPVLQKLIRFGVVGASGVGVNAGVFRLALLAGLVHHSLIAQAIAIEASIVSNYILNAWFTFRQPLAWRSMGQFNLASAGGAAIQLGIYAILFHGYHLPKTIADLLAIPFGTLITFGVSYLWIFAKRGDGENVAEPGAPVGRSGSRG